MLLKTGNQKLLFPTSPAGVCTLSSEIKMEDASWDILSNFASGKKCLVDGWNKFLIHADTREDS